MRMGQKRTLIALCLSFVLGDCLAAVQIQGIRMWPAPDNTRLVLDLNGPVEHSLFSMQEPHRIVIDLKNTQLNQPLPRFNYDKTLIKRIRHASHSNHLRIVLDLKSKIRPKSFVLKPNREYGHRLVIDLYNPDPHKAAKPSPRVKSQPGQRRDVVVAIDAGHGGEDPGATGQYGTREKTVVLAIARKLARLVQKQRGMRAILIRNGDYYVGLSTRVRKARQYHADLLISLHADAFRTPKLRGSSVFVVSDKRASSEAAQWLANNENSADLIGGVSLDDKDDLLKMVLVDMVKNSTMEDSHAAAMHILRSLKSVNKLHKSHVQRAGFKVLKAPDIPSILVEMAFISNPREETKLRHPSHQLALAKAMMKGINRYFRQNAPLGSLLARKNLNHTIEQGDTLSHIAHRYQVGIASIRHLNQLHNDVLPIGKVLRIP